MAKSIQTDVGAIEAFPMDCDVVLETITALNTRWSAAAPVIRFDEHFGGPVAELRIGSASAIVALQGGQVLSWTPASTSEALWLSPVARLGTGKAVRGGIPICWPWFGPHPVDPSKPAHGFVRAADWTVRDARQSDRTAFVSLTLTTSEDTQPNWPHQARVEVGITLGENLTVELTTENLGGEAFVLTEALHTYLSVGDVALVAIDGLDGRSYIDQRDGHQTKQQAGPITIEGELDRIYQKTADRVVVQDLALKRRTTITKSGSHSTVIWNPGPTKAARLGDIGTDGHTRMVCVETANAASDAVTLAAGERHRMTTILAVEAICA